jgi:F0F1-type ATP synthase membrane subunit b/b'
MESWIDLLFLIVCFVISQYFIINHCLKNIRKILTEMKAEIRADRERHEKRLDHLYEICISLLQRKH